MESGRPIERGAGVKLRGRVGSNAVLTIGAGQYEFGSEL
jgi:hypothetical protein